MTCRKRWNTLCRLIIICCSAAIGNDALIVCRGEVFITDELKDSYLSTRSWTRGYVWVNGHNIGRCAELLLHDSSDAQMTLGLSICQGMWRH